MKAFVIDPTKGTYGPRDVDKSLNAYYETIGCDCIDIATRFVEGVAYDIIVDDEGLLKPNYPSAASRDMTESLAGVAIVTASGAEDVESLTEDDVERLTRNMRKTLTIVGGYMDIVPVLLYDFG